MDKTLYVSDLDGTLLNSKSVLSENTVNILNRVIQEKNILFTIATARTPATVVNLMKDVNSPLPFILMAGAALWNGRKQNYERIRAISKDIVRKLVAVYDSFPINPFVYQRCDNRLLVYHSPQLRNDERLFIEPRVLSPFKQLVTTECLDIHNQDETVLIYSMGEYDCLLEIADKIKEKQVSCTISCYRDIADSSQGILELYAPNTTKAEAVSYMAKKYGAKRVVVFGDNLNDLPMMETANHSVAVGNAFDEVKKQADEIIGSNDDDAVAKWIEQDCK